MDLYAEKTKRQKTEDNRRPRKSFLPLEAADSSYTAPINMSS